MENLIPILTEIRHLQGRILGIMDAIGLDLRQEAQLESLSIDILKNAEIEGEILPDDQVRSSLARKLGIHISNAVASSRDVDGIVEVTLDALQQNDELLNFERLYSWQAALFPSGHSGMLKIKTGAWREDTTGPMQVVSGPMGMDRVHFQAPNSDVVPNEMMRFVKWFNEDQEMNLILKSAIAHLWFITIHPFEDGNGRIARALSDLLLAKADSTKQRYYSMSAQIVIDRKAYYAILEETQKGNLEIDEWMHWYLGCLKKALLQSREIVNGVLQRHKFWLDHQGTKLNERQRKIITLLLHDFKGKLHTAKWAKIAKCSTDTALRDIQDLVKKNILTKEDSGGRSTHYRHILE